jgi:hypothetical protein
MNRLPALLALVAVLMFGMAGMASATTIGFDSSPSTPPYPGISGITNMTWDDSDYTKGHLWITICSVDSIISFSKPTYVNSFQMNGMPTADYPMDSLVFAPMTIVVLADGTQVSTPVPRLGAYTDLNDDSPSGRLTVQVNTDAASSITFKAPYSTGGFFYPSIDNLVINEAVAVPIPASVWLLVSGLLGLVGLRRKFTC